MVSGRWRRRAGRLLLVSTNAWMQLLPTPKEWNCTSTWHLPSQTKTPVEFNFRFVHTPLELRRHIAPWTSGDGLQATKVLFEEDGTSHCLLQ